MAEKVDLHELIEQLGEMKTHIDAMLANARTMRNGGQDEAEPPEAWSKRLGAVTDALRQGVEMIGGEWGGPSALDDEPTAEERERAYELSRDGDPDHRKDFRPLAAGGPDNPAADSLRGLALDERTRRAVRRAMDVRNTRNRRASAAVEGIFDDATAHRYRNHA